ncbi:hypothetical protein JTB14_025405 [Gonioctena quinquepunctata]|nr:hypothetical protein JTB14_025405 [Gonioctena quinquepunctata]
MHHASVNADEKTRTMRVGPLRFSLATKSKQQAMNRREYDGIGSCSLAERESSGGFQQSQHLITLEKSTRPVRAGAAVEGDAQLKVTPKAIQNGSHLKSAPPVTTYRFGSSRVESYTFW